MKKILFLLLVSSLLFISCESNKIENEEYDYSDDDYETSVKAPEITDNFIGDFNAFRIDDMMFLQKSKGTVVPKEINGVYLVPRTNAVEFHFRDNINNVVIILEKAERDKILSVCELFLKQYEEKTLPHNKINSKTAYMNSKCSVWFGLLSAVTGSEKNDYYLNCEFIDKRPYLLLHFVPTSCEASGQYSTYTPKISLYLSPTQVREFMEQMDQEHLNSLVKGLKDKAYIY